MTLLGIPKTALALLLLIPFVTVGGPQLASASVAASFGGECAGEKASFTKQLTSLIQRSSQQAKSPCDNVFCQGVFSYDLNRDGQGEYFIRLACGATGNCTWGVFSDKPARMRGKFTAWFFYIHKSQGNWATISTYTREGGDKGVIGKLVYQRGKYRLTSERLDSGDFDNPQPYLKKMGVPKCG